MFAQTLRKISFWIGVAMAVAMPLTLVVYKWLYPPKVAKVEQDVVGLASFFLDMLNSMGDGILMMVWMSGFAAAAVLASLIAFAAAWFARESRRTKIICLLPVLLVLIVYGVLVAIEA